MYQPPTPSSHQLCYWMTPDHFFNKTNIGLLNQKHFFLNPKPQNSAFASLSPTLDLDVLPNYLIRQLGRTPRSKEGDDILKFEYVPCCQNLSPSRECVRNLDLRVQVHPGELWVLKQRVHIILEVGFPTTYSCHVDSVLLNSKFEANQSEYWNSKFKYSQIEYSNIFRRTWCFQISFLIFEDSKIGRWHFPSLHS